MSELTNFIKEARKRGFDDHQIRDHLLSKNWPLDDIEKGFAKLSKRVIFKNKISIYLDSEILKALEKRSKKNMFTLSEQIEDIIRRSVINSRKLKKDTEKLDDMLVSLFSRKTYKITK